MFDPLRDELFVAGRGHGAVLNGEPIHVSDAHDLTGAMIGTGFYDDGGEIVRRTLTSIATLFDRDIRGIRRCGSAALDMAYVARGRFEGFFEYHLSLWDYAAGWILVRGPARRGTHHAQRRGDMRQRDDPRFAGRGGGMALSTD